MNQYWRPCVGWHTNHNPPDASAGPSIPLCAKTHSCDYAENLFRRKGLPTRTKIIELRAARLTGEVPIIVDARSDTAPS